MNRKQLVKKAFIMALCILPIALVGGLFTGIYLMEHYDEATKEMILSQLGSREVFYMATLVQSGVYGLVAAFVGYFLANGIGLVKPFRFEKSTLKRVVPATVLLGIFFVGDYFIFGKMLPEVAADYEKGISLFFFLASLSYGGIIEEILLRWFFMSLVAWILWKLFAGKYSRENIPTAVFVAANLLSASLFAAGHLPATIGFFGHLNARILFRCFLLNGGFGLAFGHFYRKYGIQYAMLCHFGIHFVSKLILMLLL